MDPIDHIYRAAMMLDYVSPEDVALEIIDFDTITPEDAFLFVHAAKLLQRYREND